MVALELLPIHYGRVEALELRKSTQQRTTRKRHHEVWHKLARKKFANRLVSGLWTKRVQRPNLIANLKWASNRLAFSFCLNSPKTSYLL